MAEVAKKVNPKVKAGFLTGGLLAILLSALSVTLEAVNPTMFTGLGVWAVPASLFVVAVGQGIAAYQKQDNENFSPAELQEAVEVAVSEAVKEYAEAELRRKLKAEVAPATEEVIPETDEDAVLKPEEYVNTASAVG